MRLTRRNLTNIIIGLIILAILGLIFYIPYEGFQQNNAIRLPNAPSVGSRCFLETVPRRRDRRNNLQNCSVGFEPMPNKPDMCGRSGTMRCPSNSMTNVNRCQQNCSVAGSGFTSENFGRCKHKVSGNIRFVNQLEPVCVANV